MNTLTRMAAVFGTVVVAAVVVTGCTQKSQEPYKDAPRSKTNLGPQWTVVRAPDGFSNLATTCLTLPGDKKTGIRLFSAYHGDSPYGSITSQLDKNC